MHHVGAQELLMDNVVNAHGKPTPLRPVPVLIRPITLGLQPTIFLAPLVLEDICVVGGLSGRVAGTV